MTTPIATADPKIVQLVRETAARANADELYDVVVDQLGRYVMVREWAELVCQIFPDADYGYIFGASFMWISSSGTNAAAKIEMNSAHAKWVGAQRAKPNLRVWLDVWFRARRRRRLCWRYYLEHQDDEL